MIKVKYQIVMKRYFNAKLAKPWSKNSINANKKSHLSTKRSRIKSFNKQNHNNYAQYPIWKLSNTRTYKFKGHTSTWVLRRNKNC